MVSRKLGILFLISVVLAFFAGYYSSNVINEPAPNNRSDLFSYVTRLMDEYYYYDIDSLDEQQALIASIEAAIRSYAIANNDPYTRLVSTPLNVTPRSDEKFVGIGINVSTEGNLYRVQYVYPNSAAENNLYPNDLIIGVLEDEAIYFEDLSSSLESSTYLVGDVDDEKTLIVEDPDGVISHVTIIYKEIETPTVFAKDLLEDNIAYLRITQFSGYQEGITAGTDRVFFDRLAELESTILNQSPENKTLILDLRDNPGGALTALHNQKNTSSTLFQGITQQLLRRDLDQPLFEMIPKSGEGNIFFGGQTTAKPYDIKVLVNENSASAAEVLAAALNTRGGYTLYGSQTYGKGVYQNYIYLTDIGGIRYSLAFTEGEWFYDDGKNVSTDPLAIETIEQTGIQAIDMPVYGGEVAFNQISLALVNYQNFLNYFFDFSGDDLLRTDGYFDLATENAIIAFNTLYDIENESILSKKTAIHIHQIYMNDMFDIHKDVQLQSLIDIIKNT
ncbi:S41 family peptidase [Peloplasma aerotolerans]|uniref:S41 family peptidase n=1 Tax=Peloplasma aerotolerans TaxID=3044389 RepID=A0AAW6U942_9MOLU|nr:S41 family peptidase [Mariniplasma sp. M4Ah]MDI6453415.1 S41 family peptidase [Mariniplasma sp. M4Ah]